MYPSVDLSMRSDDPIPLQSPLSEHCFYYIYYMVKPSIHLPSGGVLYTEKVTKGLETLFQNFQNPIPFNKKCSNIPVNAFKSLEERGDWGMGAGTAEL